MFCPDIPFDSFPARKHTISAKSLGVVTLLSAVTCAMRSNTSGVVTLDASVVLSRPPDTMLHVIPNFPNSAAQLRMKPSNAPFPVVYSW